MSKQDDNGPPLLTIAGSALFVCLGVMGYLYSQIQASDAARVEEAHKCCSSNNSEIVAMRRMIRHELAEIAGHLGRIDGHLEANAAAASRGIGMGTSALNTLGAVLHQPAPLITRAPAIAAPEGDG